MVLERKTMGSSEMESGECISGSERADAVSPASGQASQLRAGAAASGFLNAIASNLLDSDLFSMENRKVCENFLRHNLICK
jgi:hypothetical protein